MEAVRTTEEVTNVVTGLSQHVVATAEYPISVVIAEGSANVVISDEPDVIVEEQVESRIVTIGSLGPVGPIGPQGPQGEAGAPGVSPRTYTRPAEAGVVTYSLPELPYGTIQVSMNGVQIAHTLSGVNVTITEYSPGTIEATDELTFHYFVEG